jgi:predicted methyltransferase
MSEVSIQTLSPQRVVLAVLRQLNQEQIEDAVACFTTDCRYKDHGIGLEFRDKERLTEFFRKTRKLYPDYFLQADQTFVSAEHVIT